MTDHEPHRVRFKGAIHGVRTGETVLDAFVRGGADVRFSCRRGTCHVCVLQIQSGEPGPESRRGLSEEEQEAGLFLPCQALPRTDLEVVEADLSALSVKVHVQEREWLSGGVVRLALESETTFTWRAGQFISLEHPSGAQRSYSIAASVEDAYYIELHVRRVANGLVSSWLCDEVAVGDILRLRGPFGDCVYDPLDADRDLLLVAGGTGLAPLIGVAKDALRLGHRGRIELVHGSSHPEGLYLGADLRALAELEGPDRFRYHACLDTQAGNAVDAAFARDRFGTVAYFAGPPAMVYEARYRAILAGVARADIHADPFEPVDPYMPDDKAKLAVIEPDPELWAALDHGPGLTTILTDFYGRVYSDPRLAPFFHNVTQSRAIQKQYEFLSEVFTGSRHFLGARPFNAHHWMVISDELFDYREDLLVGCMRRHGLADALIRRWSAIHERFRREIVKTHQRGMIIDGVERIEIGYREEQLDFDGVCDGCHTEIPAGTVSRHHLPSGQLYCGGCEAKPVASHA